MQAKFLIPNESGRTIVVHGMVRSSNTSPELYSDSVVFTCDDEFHLELIPESGLLENNALGAHGGWKIGDEVNGSWVTMGYDYLDGKIPADYQYSVVLTVLVKVVPEKEASIPQK